MSRPQMRKWCTKWPAAAMTIAWVDCQRIASILQGTSTYVAHSPTSSTPLLRRLCSCPSPICPHCHKACTNPWHAKYRRTKTSFSHPRRGSGAARLLVRTAPRRRARVLSNLAKGGDQRAPPNQPVTARVPDARWGPRKLLVLRPVPEDPSAPPKQRATKSAPVDLRAASRVWRAWRSWGWPLVTRPRK